MAKKTDEKEIIKNSKPLVINTMIRSQSVAFTPAFYKRAFRNYQNGDYRDLIALFDRAEIDSFVGGCMTTRTAGYKKSWDIQPVSENAQDVEIAEFVKNTFSNIGIRDLFDQIIGAKMKIYSVTAIEWDIKNGKQVPIDFTFYDQKYFRHDKDGILKIDWGTELREIPTDSALVVQSKRKPIFLKVLKDFIRKEFGEDNWSSFIETFGEPFIIGYYSSPEQKTDMESAVNSIAGSTRMVAPEGGRIEIKETTRATGDHKSYQEDCKRGISFTLLGNESASGNSDGAQIGENLEASKAKHEVAVEDMYFIQDEFSKLIKMVVARNYNITDYPKLTIDKSSAIDEKIRLDAVRTAYDFGGEIDPQFFADYGIPLIGDKPLVKADGLP